MKETEAIKASKFVTDPGYKWKDYSRDSIKLVRKQDNQMLFVPKSVCDIAQPNKNHESVIDIQKWWIDNGNRWFFTGDPPPNNKRIFL